MPDETRSVLDGAIRPWHRHGPRLLREALFEVAERHGFSLEAPVAELPPAAREVLLFGDDQGFPGVVPYLRRRVESLLRLDPSPADEDGHDGGEAFEDLRPYLVRGGVPGVPGHAAAAREPRGARRGATRWPTSCACRSPAPARSRPRSSLRRAGARRSGSGSSGRSWPALDVLRLARPRLPHPRPGDHHPLRRRSPPPAARHPDRGADAGARSTSSTSRRWVCTSATTPGSSRPSSRSATPGTRSWWSSTTRRRSGPPTGSSTSARAPGADGGRLMYAGPPASIDGSLTGRYLRGELEVPVPVARRAARGWLRVLGARAHNLRDVDVAIPHGRPHRGDRRLGLGQVHPRGGRAAPGPRPAPLPGRPRSPGATARSRARRRSTR